MLEGWRHISRLFPLCSAAVSLRWLRVYASCTHLELSRKTSYASSFVLLLRVARGRIDVPHHAHAVADCVCTGRTHLLFSFSVTGPAKEQNDEGTTMHTQSVRVLATQSVAALAPAATRPFVAGAFSSFCTGPARGGE